MSRDNWERLVAAVLKREQIWQLCHEDSRSPSISTISSDFSGQILSFSSNSLEPISVSPSPPVPLKNPSVSRVSNNASGPITRRLFSAMYRRRKPKDKYLVDIPAAGEEDLGIDLGQVRRFTLHELQVATENFSKKNVFEHGYNMVYKGWLADGSPVVVKRHKDRGAQHAEVQFQKVVEISSIAAHRNVLHVLGVCITPKERLLVYPLMDNGSVASCLQGKHKSQPPLNWPIRKGIALGAARGLAYLHEDYSQKIIHRDIKAENILLDKDFEAVIGQLELAITMDHNATYAYSELSGKISHIAPEYPYTGKWSEKTDVFGYGMFLLELITGRIAHDLAWVANGKGMALLDWVMRNFEERKWEVIADPYCGGNHMEEVVELLTKIALICTQRSPLGRPKMSQIVRLLDV